MKAPFRFGVCIYCGPEYQAIFLTCTVPMVRLVKKHGAGVNFDFLILPRGWKNCTKTWLLFFRVILISRF